MKRESLGAQENHDEGLELDLTSQVRGGTHVLTLEEIANLAAEEGNPPRR